MDRSGAAQHTLCPEAAAAGGMGIADAVLLVFLEQLAMATVKAGGKIEFVELSAEGLIFLAVPHICQRLLLDIAEGAMGDLPADVVQIGIAVVEQRHAGAHLAVSPDKGHALPDKFAVAGFPQHRLVVEVEIEILLAHQICNALCCFGNVQIKERQPHRRQHTALAGAGVHIYKAGVQQFVLGCFIRGGNVGYVHLVHQVLGDEEGQLAKLMDIALHGNKGDPQRNAAQSFLPDLVQHTDVA